MQSFRPFADEDLGGLSADSTLMGERPLSPLMTVLAGVGSGLFETAFTAALIAGGLLFLGGLVSFAVFAYRSVKGEGMRDPREVAPEETEDDDVERGDSDDEWDYY